MYVNKYIENVFNCDKTRFVIISIIFHLQCVYMLLVYKYEPMKEVLIGIQNKFTYVFNEIKILIFLFLHEWYVIVFKNGLVRS